MAANPNNLSQFWQELKRRKVVRVITVYAAAAFAILELTDIVAPSLGLPGWTLNFVIILLGAGLIITVVFSWIYDKIPEGGFVKTEATQDTKAVDKQATSSSWRVASYISFVEQYRNNLKPIQEIMNDLEVKYQEEHDKVQLG